MEDVFEWITLPCLRLVLLLDVELSVVVPAGLLWVALLWVFVVVLWPSLVVVVVVLDCDDVWE